MKLFALSFLLYTPLTFAATDVVNLKYDWKPGIKANAYFHFVRTQSRQGQVQTQEIRGKQPLTTQAHAKGLQINFGPTELESIPTKSEQTKLQQLMEKVMSASPSYVVDTKGNVVNVLGLEELRTAMDKMLIDAIPSDNAEVLNKIRSNINNLYSDANSLEIVSKSWSRDVTQWIGATFEKDEIYSIDYEMPIPLLGSFSVPATGQYQYLGKVKCQSSDREKRCAKLIFKSQPDEVAMSQASIALAQKMGAQNTVPKVQLHIDYQVELITEYNTLRPYLMVESRSTRIETENAPDSIQTERKEIAYQYY